MGSTIAVSTLPVTLPFQMGFIPRLSHRLPVTEGLQAHAPETGVTRPGMHVNYEQTAMKTMHTCIQTRSDQFHLPYPISRAGIRDL